MKLPKFSKQKKNKTLQSVQGTFTCVVLGSACIIQIPDAIWVDVDWGNINLNTSIGIPWASLTTYWVFRWNNTSYPVQLFIAPDGSLPSENLKRTRATVQTEEQHTQPICLMHKAQTLLIPNTVRLWEDHVWATSLKVGSHRVGWDGMGWGTLRWQQPVDSLQVRQAGFYCPSPG